jgi:hypothetical protein
LAKFSLIVLEAAVTTGVTSFTSIRLIVMETPGLVPSPFVAVTVIDNEEALSLFKSVMLFTVIAPVLLIAKALFVVFVVMAQVNGVFEATAVPTAVETALFSFIEKLCPAVTTGAWPKLISAMQIRENKKMAVKILFIVLKS